MGCCRIRHDKVRNQRLLACSASCGTIRSASVTRCSHRCAHVVRDQNISSALFRVCCRKAYMDALTGVDSESESSSSGSEEEAVRPGSKPAPKNISLETLKQHGYSGGPSVLFTPEPQDDQDNQWNWCVNATGLTVSSLSKFMSNQTTFSRRAASAPHLYKSCNPFLHSSLALLRNSSRPSTPGLLAPSTKLRSWPKRRRKLERQTSARRRLPRRRLPSTRCEWWRTRRSFGKRKRQRMRRGSWPRIRRGRQRCG